MRRFYLDQLESRQLYSASIVSLATFTDNSGDANRNQLVLDSRGNLYGTTLTSIFRIAAGTHRLKTLSTGLGGFFGLSIDTAGNLYGTDTYNSTVFEISGQNGKMRKVAVIDPSTGSPTSVVIDSQGNLYGTTEEGNAGEPSVLGGSVFEIAAGTHRASTLATFGGRFFDTPKGLALDNAGNIYGWTEGLRSTFFEISASTHKLENINLPHSFISNITSDLHGNLYGIDSSGIVEIPAGTHAFTTLAPLNSSIHPDDLLIDSAGNVFGTSQIAGGNNSGIVFELAIGSHTVSTLATFPEKNGSYALSGLTPDAAGALYAMTADSTATNANASDARAIVAISNSGFVPASNAKPTIILQPTDEVSSPGQTAKFNIALDGYPNPTIQWQLSTDSGKTFHDLTGNQTASTANLRLAHLTLAQSATQYRAVITNSLGTISTRAATLSVALPLMLVNVAHAGASIVTGTSTALGAVASDPTGGRHLTYTWAATKSPAGSKALIFPVNGTAAATKTTATFSKAGGYTFRCTISADGVPLLTTNTSVTVAQTAIRLRITSGALVLKSGASASVQAVVLDQFGKPLRAQPSVHYSIVRGQGQIGSSDGIFTATIWPGPVRILAESGSLSEIIELLVTG